MEPVSQCWLNVHLQDEYQTSVFITASVRVHVFTRVEKRGLIFLKNGPTLYPNHEKCFILPTGEYWLNTHLFVV